MCSSEMGVDDFKENSSFIQHCDYYINTLDSFECFKCEQGYIVEEDQKECLVRTDQHCLIMRKSDLKCIECESGFVSVKGKCQTKNIDYCVDFEDNYDLED